MNDERNFSERSRSVVIQTAQAGETTGSRPVVHRAGASVGGSAGMASEMSMTGSLSIDSLPAHVRAAGVAATGVRAAIPASTSGARSSRGAVTVMKSPEGRGADIQELFARKDIRVMKGGVVREVQAVQNYLRQACQEARQIVASAAEDVQKAQLEARETGRAEAFAELFDELKRARNEYDRLMSGAEADMIELAFQIARQIIGHSIEVDSGVLRDIVAKSLVHVRGKRQIVVFVHPEDLPKIEVLRHELAQEVEGAALYFGGDAQVERGGCVIETESGRLDARLEVQLNVLRGVLLKGGK